MPVFLISWRLISRRPMHKIILLLVLCLTLLCGQASARTPLIPVEELHPGMTGYAKTVIDGDKIEEFPVEILGVTGNETMGYQILIKAGGDVMERSGGIAQGMSGSPVYIDGRLAGAVAFGRSFTDSHYCFLTPIEDMLKILEEPVSTVRLDRPDTGDATLLPKGTQLMAGGFNETGLRYLQDRLAPYGLTAMNAGGAGSPHPVGDLEPGSAVGVSMVQGDLTVGALGTVTWVDEQGRILAFGHPFLQRGKSAFFMNKVWVFASLPNLQSAYKIGSLGDVIGTINQDRAAGIAGQIGKEPLSIPVFVAVADLDRSNNTTVRAKVVEDEVLAPELMSSVVVNTAAKAVDNRVGGSAKVTFRIDAKDQDRKPILIVRQNMYYSPKGLFETLTPELRETASVLLRNKLEDVEITGVNVDVEMSTESLVADIQSASVREDKVKAGEDIHIDVKLKPYRGKEITRTVVYHMPKDAKGTVDLTIRGGAAMNWIQQLMRNQKEEGIPVKKKKKKKEPNLRDYIRDINRADRNNDIIVEYAVKPMMPLNPKRMPPPMEEPGEMEEGGFDMMLSGGPNKQNTAIDLIVDGETSVTVKVSK